MITSIQNTYNFTRSEFFSWHKQNGTSNGFQKSFLTSPNMYIYIQKLEFSLNQAFAFVFKNQNSVTWLTLTW